MDRVARTCLDAVVYKAVPFIGRWTGAFLHYTVGKVIHAAVCTLSPKHGVRPDSYIANLRRVFGLMSESLYIRTWKINCFAKRIQIDVEARHYLTHLDQIGKLAQNNSLAWQPDVAEGMKRFIRWVLHAPKTLNHLAELDLSVYSRCDGDLTYAHRMLKRALSFADYQVYEKYADKLKNLNAKLGQPLAEDEKLTLADVNIVASAQFMIDFLKALKSKGIDDLDGIIERWESIAGTYQSEGIEQLKKACLSSRASGTIFIGDWDFYNISFGNSLECSNLVNQLYTGRICHAGVFVEKEGKSFSSHINFGTNSHALTPNLNLLRIAYLPSVVLDITSLLPKAAAAHHQELSACFTSAFARLASEEHKEIKISTWKEDYSMALFSHTQRQATVLEHVDWPKPETKMMCSAYVGLVFLMALKEVNRKLETLGYKERIAHPFPHENLDRLDVLRLLYLWNQLKVVKAAELNPIVKNSLKLLEGFDLKITPIAKDRVTKAKTA
jgi:hypothetical protein